jgi:organic hydroperoxide reductase OsmC/OhrA
VHIGSTDAGGFGLAVDLDVSLPAAARADAERVADLAHGVCPYSNATRDNIAVTVRVV